MKKPAINIRNLGVALARDYVVTLERLVVDAGEVVLLDAPSGSGKSTALGLISGAVHPVGVQGGLHQVCGINVRPKMERSKFARCNMLGIVMQSTAMVPFLTLRENIELPARFDGLPLDRDWWLNVCERLNIADLLERRPSDVSVGQRQRAAIARAVAGKPKILLLDEPVAALDPANVARAEQLIEQLSSVDGTTVVYASHLGRASLFSNARRVFHRLSTRNGVVRSLFTDQNEERKVLRGVA